MDSQCGQSKTLCWNKYGYFSGQVCDSHAIGRENKAFIESFTGKGRRKLKISL
jgi:hypothetical protein